MSDKEKLTQLTVDIIANFVANNTVPASDVGEMIRAVYNALASLDSPSIDVEPELFVPAISARKSLADPAKIISMIDGKRYSMLKRHLAQHGLTPDTYRSRYNLPPNYPMTAPAYSEQRKALAVQIGLGRKPVSLEAAPEPTSAPAKGRRKLGIAVTGDGPKSPSPVPSAAAKPKRLSGKAALAKVRGDAV